VKIALHEFLYKKNRQQQIKGFYYVARHQSISKAAQAMNLTQSTVTLQIQSLERDLGFALLRRDTKPLSLTEEGEEFYTIACPLMHEFESVVEKFLDRKKQKAQKKVDIAIHHIAISYLMPRIISHFKKTNPDAKILIRNIAPIEAVKALKDGKIDLAFYPNLSHAAEIKQIDSISYDPVLIINKHHPLVKKEIKSLSDLKDFDLIRIDHNLITLPLFEEAVRTH
jgi:DNA-binding transcriptional LysR family regulator